MAIANRSASGVQPTPVWTLPKASDSIRQVAAVFALFVTMQPFAGGPLGPATRLAAVASAGIALLVVGTRPLRTIQMMKTVHMRAVFIIPLASMVWSVNRPATAIALLSFIGATAIALLIIQELRPDRALAAVAYATCSALLLSVAADLYVAPLRAGESFGVSGIFDHKNSLGRAAILLSFAAFVGWSIRSRGRTLLAGAALVFSVLVGVWSASGTSVFTVGVAIAVFLAIIVRQLGPFRDPRILYGSVMLALAAATASAMLIGPIDLFQSVLSTLGRETDNNTLFVRLSLWDATLSEIVKRPIGGFGYGTFDFERVTVSTGRRTVVWEAQQPHNGMLDVAYQLGILGLAAFSRHLIALWRSVSRSIRRRTLGPYLFLFGLVNITYSALYGTLAIFWVVHIIVIWAAVRAPSRVAGDGAGR